MRRYLKWFAAGLAFAVGGALAQVPNSGVPLTPLAGPQDLGTLTAAVNGLITQLNANRGLQLLSSQQANNATNLLFGPFPVTVNTVFLDCNQITPSNSGTTFQLQVVESGSIKTAGYNYADITIADNTTTLPNAVTNTADSGFNLGAVDKTNGQENLSAKLWLSNLPSTAFYKMLNGQSIYGGASVHYTHTILNGVYTADAGVVTGVNFKFSSNNIATGNCSVYALLP